MEKIFAGLGLFEPGLLSLSKTKTIKIILVHRKLHINTFKIILFQLAAKLLNILIKVKF